MKVLVRLIADDDSLMELTALLHAAYAQLAALGFNYTAVDQTEDITRQRIEDGECYVALVEDQLVGTILFHDASKPNGSCPWFERTEVSTFHQFGVLPAFQNRGIGGSLLMFVEKRARELGALEIAFDTSEGAVDLLRWYIRRGYREVAHAQWKGKTYRSVIMSKTLAQSSN
jgi:GNAT superfamily N-acetyltransferase